jgi:hypothetical protein
MFSMGFPGWGLGWSGGWGWAAAVGGILLLGIFLLPWFFFLLNLHTTLDRVNDRNRAMPAGHVWLNFIPIFNLGWFIYTVTKVRDSVRGEYQSRGWAPDGDFGYNVGLTTGILAIASFFIGWVPVLGWGIGLALLVCWIIYWLKMSDLKNRLGQQGPWQRTAAPYGYSGPAAPPAGPGAAPYQATPPWQSTAAATAAATAATAGATAPAVTPSAAVPRAADSVGEAVSDAGPSEEEKVGRQCAVCGAAFDPGDRFCRVCGLRLP